jgi:hypothetical protein
MSRTFASTCPDAGDHAACDLALMIHGSSPDRREALANLAVDEEQKDSM